MHSGLADDILWMHSSGPEGIQEMRVDLLDRGGVCEDAIAVLRENAGYPAQGPEVSFGLSWKLDPESGVHDPSFSVTHAMVGSDSHSRLLGWLHSMEHMEGELVVEGDELVHRSTRAEARVDAVNGFLKRLALTSPEGVERSMDLVRVDLETALDLDDFLPPEPVRGAKDVSDGMRALLSRHHVRLSALHYVHGTLDGGERRLDGELHDELERFFVALYDSKITGDLENWIRSNQDYAIQYAEWIRSEIQAGRQREELEAAAGVRRGELDANLQEYRAKVATIVPADPERYADSDHWRAIRDLENEVLLARYDVLVARPILDDFDARVDAALDE